MTKTCEPVAHALMRAASRLISTHGCLVGQAGSLRRIVNPPFFLFLVVALLLVPPACKSRKVKVGATDEETPRMMSTLNLGDPKVEPQLVKGFHGIEASAWRWTEKQFTVALHPPFGASQKGAKLAVKLTVPAVTIEKLKTVSLAATVGASSLPPETYTSAGDYFYVRDLPASLMGGDSIRVDFQLDKAMPPNGADVRELGIIVFSIGLEANK